MPQMTTFSRVTSLLRRDPVVCRIFPRSTREIIFNSCFQLSSGFLTARCAGSFSWTAMLLRLFVIVSEFGIRRPSHGLSSSAGKRRQTVLPHLTGVEDFSMGYEVQIWTRGTKRCILLSNGWSGGEIFRFVVSHQRQTVSVGFNPLWDRPTAPACRRYSRRKGSRREYIGGPSARSGDPAPTEVWINKPQQTPEN